MAKVSGRKPRFALLFTGLVLGLGWAIRGVFGPEWGAAWAGSLGALGVVVALNREDWLRRAPILAAFGAGLGFSTGNQFQTLSLAAGIPINAWNFMEFLLGLGGGAGMAYAVLTCEWPECPAPPRGLFWGALVFAVAVLPAVNRMSAFTFDRFVSTAENLNLADPGAFASFQLLVASVVCAIMVAAILLLAWWQSRKPAVRWNYAIAGLLFLYALLGAVKTSILYTPFSPGTHASGTCPASPASSSTGWHGIGGLPDYPHWRQTKESTRR